MSHGPFIKKKEASYTAPYSFRMEKIPCNTVWSGRLEIVSRW